MGYDFMFIRVKDAGKKRSPLTYADVPEGDLEGALPWSDFRNWLLTSLRGRENGEENSIWVEYVDQASINFSGDSSSIYLDTHAPWSEVLRAFLTLKSLTEDACLFDLQGGIYHNEESFCALIRANTKEV